MDAAQAFYARYCGLRPVHERLSDGHRVAWLGWGEDPPRFVIVLTELPFDTNEQTPLQHIGMAVDARDEVARIYAAGVAAGISRAWAPTDAGQIVGYYCALADPDGNLVEFSFGQRIG